jgi:DNA-binding MarR family transcriptional regulator
VGDREATRAGPLRVREDALEAVRALTRASTVIERASSELSLAHYRVLSAIAAGDHRATRIAAKLAIGKPAVSATVESLRQRGLLAADEVEGDNRATALILTPAGAALLGRVEDQMLARMDDLCARTPDGDALIEALVWLGKAMDARRDELEAQRAGTR